MKVLKLKYVVILLVLLTPPSYAFEVAPWQAGLSLGTHRLDDYFFRETDTLLIGDIFGTQYMKGLQLRVKRNFNTLPFSLQGEFQFFTDEVKKGINGDTSITIFSIDSNLVTAMAGVNWIPFRNRWDKFQPYLGGYLGWIGGRVAGRVSFLDTTNPNAHRLIVGNGKRTLSSFGGALGGGFEHYFADRWSFDLQARYLWTSNSNLDGINVLAGANYSF